MQIQCSGCGHKLSITRMRLGLDPDQRIAPGIRRKLGLLGALTTFRVAETFTVTVGLAINKMTIWRSVQRTGEEIAFSLDPKEEARGEADGTGIGIRGIKKRGRELKVQMQYMKGGAIRVAGIDIGSYNGHWNRLFKRNLKALQEPPSFFLVTDGDTSILDGLAGKVKIFYQRCLWHIPHQLKFALWQDRAKVLRKSPEWLSVMARVYEICSLRSGLDEDDEIRAWIALKTKMLDAFVEDCREKEYRHTVAYLESAKNDLFTGISNRLKGKTTSRVEWLFRTGNMRVNVSQWTTPGALNVTQVRLVYDYNGFDPTFSENPYPEGFAQVST